MTHQRAKEGKKRIRNRIGILPPYLHPRHKSVVSSFPPLRAEENWKIDFTADETEAVKAASASFPLLIEEENWKIDFTADESGGKAATASFPPLRAEETWKMQFYRRCERR